MTGEQLLIKTIKQCNAFEKEVIELKSYIAKLKSTMVFANNVIDDLKTYSVNQRQMVNSYLEYIRDKI